MVFDMNTKILSYSLLLSSLLCTSVFAMDDSSDEEEKGTKRPHVEEVGRNVKARTQTVPIEDVVSTAPPQKSIDDFYKKVAREEKLGPFSYLSMGTFYNLFTWVDPLTMRGLNRSTYTLIMGYEEERIGLIGCGPDKLPDYSDALYLLKPSGRSNIVKRYLEPTHATNKTLYVDKNGRPFICGNLLDAYTPNTVPSALWYVYLTYVDKPPVAFSNHFGGTNIRFLNLSQGWSHYGDDGFSEVFKNLAQKGAQPSKLEKIWCNDTELDENDLDLLLASLKTNHPQVGEFTVADDAGPFDFDSFAHFKGTNVHTLGLNDENLDGPSVLSILSFLAGSSVKNLSLNGNHLADLNTKKFVLLRNQTQIETISLQNCNIDSGLAFMLLTELGINNTGLTYLDLRSNPVDNPTIADCLRLRQRDDQPTLTIVFDEPEDESEESLEDDSV